MANGGEWTSDLGASTSKQRGEISSTMLRLLNERLTLLEEETQALKTAFIQGMEERKRLLNEIYQQFQTIHCNSGKEAETGTGISQVLCQQSNSLITFRDLRVNPEELQLAAVMYEFSNR